ncbi:hypothetical protein F4803DRAFT_454 [Xylaria telfairii]|nr:hypothetical protein F4803DRAFT_454 [Xylaria telfairii]
MSSEGGLGLQGAIATVVSIFDAIITCIGYHPRIPDNCVQLVYSNTIKLLLLEAAHFFPSGPSTLTALTLPHTLSLTFLGIFRPRSLWSMSHIAFVSENRLVEISRSSDIELAASYETRRLEDQAWVVFIHTTTNWALSKAPLPWVSTRSHTSANSSKGSRLRAQMSRTTTFTTSWLVSILCKPFAATLALSSSNPRLLAHRPSYRCRSRTVITSRQRRLAPS